MAIKFSLIASELKKRVNEVVLHLWSNGSKNSNYWCVGSVYNDTSTSRSGGSFRVTLTGESAGLCRDFNSDDQSYDLLEAWSKRFSISKVEAAQQATKWLKLRESTTDSKKNLQSKNRTVISISAKKKEADQSLNKTWTDKLVNHLRSNHQALDWLYKRGLNDETITKFKLGLSRPNSKSNRSHALTFPIRTFDGSFLSKNGYYCIDGLTLNAVDQNSWMSGTPRAYYANAYQEQRYAFVIEGIKDAWIHYQHLKNHDLLHKYLICVSTHSSSIPQEWKNPEFWQKFEKIYLGHNHDSAGDLIATKLSEITARECYRVKVPYHYAQPKTDQDGYEKPMSEWGANWTDFWKKDGSKKDFLNLIKDSPLISLKIKSLESTTNLALEAGRYNVNPVDINGAYINGYMYYPARTLIIQEEFDEYKNVCLVERYETI